MSNPIDDFTDDELYASYEAYKTLLDAGLSKQQALDRTGLTAQIVKDFQDEEEDDDFKSEFKDEWDSDDDFNSLDEDGFESDNLEDDFDDSFDEGGGYDESYD
ncbi:MAG: hypothetical protein EAZ07_09175 [Cytophagales bacterium]|nr:MAG: hypothetical protein EAZ07_09175 [Cytophagales bacterium]